MKTLFTMMVLAMVMVGFSVAGSDAGVKKIRPDQLKILISDMVFIQNPRLLKSIDTRTCTWTSVVKRIAKLKYYHRGETAGFPYISVTLLRVKMGDFPKVTCSPKTGLFSGSMSGRNNQDQGSKSASKRDR